MNSTSPRIIRVDPATVIIFSVLFSPALLMAVLLIWRGQQIPEALGLCVVYVVMVYWICSPSLELGQDQLTYHAFLTQKTIALSEVTGVKMSASPAPTIHLVRKQHGVSSFSFIIKPFSKLGVVALMHHLRSHCPGARFDEIANDLDRGDFGSVTRAAISTRNMIRFVVAGASATFAAAIVRALLHR